ELELQCREVELDAIDPGSMSLPIHPEHPEGDRGFIADRGLLPTQHRRNPERQLTHTERFDDVVVGADLEANYPVDLLTARCQHHDGDMLRAVLSLDLAANVEPSDVRQHDVEQDQLGLLFAD